MSNKEITLDDILMRKRRAEASKTASAILGKRRHEVARPAPKQQQQQQYPQQQHPQQPLRVSGSGAGAGAATTSTRWTHDLHHKTNPNASRVSKPPTNMAPAVARSLQNNRLFAALHSDRTAVKATSAAPARTRTSPVNPSPPTAPKNTVGVSIRGSASKAAAGSFQIKGTGGPAVVQMSNFAPGTTAADILHALEPIGKVLSCLVLTANPSVIAEVVFERKGAAELCIAQYNGQKADGRLLHVCIKDSPPLAQLGALGRDHYHEREEADRRRREQNIHFQDGRYGVKPPPMYSDALMQKGRGFDS